MGWMGIHVGQEMTLDGELGVGCGVQERRSLLGQQPEGGSAVSSMAPALNNVPRTHTSPWGQA